MSSVSLGDKIMSTIDSSDFQLVNQSTVNSSCSGPPSPPVMPRKALLPLPAPNDCSNMSIRKPNHILIVSVLNAAYPITTSVFSKICPGSMPLVRVVVLKKKSDDVVQALLEFYTERDASKFKDSMDGADIYDNCCTMKIEYAFESVFRLRVLKNDDESWDFSAQPEPMAVKRKFPPIVDATRWSAPKRRRPLNHEAASYGCVCMVYNLNMAKISPNRLFNIFCLYGNVVRIRFLASKPGCAMVEMAAPEFVSNLLRCLNDGRGHLFGSDIAVGPCRQEYVYGGDESLPPLGNGAPSFADYTGSSMHRFKFRGDKNRILFPTRIVHFYNFPLGYDGLNDLNDHFATRNAPLPIGVRVFNQEETDKSLSGLLEFPSVSEAMDAMALCNNRPLGQDVVKLSFSVNESLDASS